MEQKQKEYVPTISFEQILKEMAFRGEGKAFHKTMEDYKNLFKVKESKSK